MENQLQYGSIIKIQSSNRDYGKQLFFINYISKQEMHLISNKGMKDVKFYFDEDGSIDDESIEEFTVIHRETRGYAELHGLKVGVTVNIYFDTQIPYILTGNITNVENDSVEITPMNEEIKDMPLYLDFKYQGLDPDLMINRIEVRKDTLTKRRDDNDVNLEEDDEEVTHDSDKDSDVDDDDEREEYEEMSVVSQLQYYDNDNDQFVYNLDQQINDFIDEFYYGKPELTKRDKLRLKTQVLRYIQMRNKYTIFDESIGKKLLPKMQLLDSFMKLKNTDLALPVTSDVIKEFHLTNGDLVNVDDMDRVNYTIKTDDQYESEVRELMKLNKDEEYAQVFEKQGEFLENQNINITDKHRDESDEDNNAKFLIDFGKQKNVPSIMIADKDVILDYNYYNVSDNKLIQNNKFATIDNVETKKLLVNGFAFVPLHRFKYLQSITGSTSLMEKVSTNLQPYYNFKPQIIVKDDISEKCQMFSKSYQFVPFLIKDKYDEYFQNNIKEINELIQCHIGSNYINMYEIIRLLHVANIDELTKNNFKITRAHCHRNIVAYEKLIRNYRKKLNEILKKQSNRQIENSDFITAIKNTYDSKNLRRELYKENIEDNSLRVNNYDSEIFEKTNLDNQDVMAKTIQLEFVGSQPDETLLEEYEEELKNELTNLENGVLPASKNPEIKKVYESMMSMKEDENKIIIPSNVNRNGENVNTYTFFHNELIKNLGTSIYTNSSDALIDKINQILESKTLELSEHKDLFGDNRVLVEVLKMVNYYKFKSGDKCMVKNSRKIFVYNENDYKWEEQGMFKSKNKMKRGTIKFNQEMKDKNKIAEELYHTELDRILDNFAHKKYVAGLNKKIDYDDEIIKAKKRLLYKMRQTFYKNLKYNQMKYYYELQINKSNWIVQSNKKSPYEFLMYEIIAEEDLDLKYESILKFAKKFTSDIDDGPYLFCVDTAVPLLPRFYVKLANAYIVHNNLHSVIDDLCFKEGELSEDGDKWIHKATGHLLKYISFDNEEGYDDNGMKNKTREVLGNTEDITDINLNDLYEFEFDFNPEVHDDENKEHYDTNLKINMNDFKKKIYNLFSYYCELLGININSGEVLEHINVINQIYTYSQKFSHDVASEKYGKYKSVTYFVYSVITYILLFVQTHRPMLNIKTIYPDCASGYKKQPLEDEDRKKQIGYIACFIKSITKNISKSSEVYGYISKAKLDDLHHDLEKFVDNYTLKNQSIQNMIKKMTNYDIKNGKIINGEFEFKEVNENKIQNGYLPSLISIDLNLNDEGLSKLKSKINKADYYRSKSTYHDIFNFLMKAFQKEVNTVVNNKEYLLLTKKLIPYQINTCCNEPGSINKLNTLSYFINENAELKKIVDLLSVNYITEEPLFHTFKTQPSTRIDNIDFLSADYDEKTIYTGIIDLMNFDRNTSIPEHLQFISDNKKPRQEYYNKNMSLEEKIEAIRTNMNINIESNQFKDIIQKHHQYLLATRSKENKKPDDKLVHENVYLDEGSKDNQQKLEEFIEMVNTNKEIKTFEKQIDEQFFNPLYTSLIERIKKLNIKFNLPVDILKSVVGRHKNTVKSYNYLQYLRNLSGFMNDILREKLLNKTLIQKRRDVVCGHWDIATEHKSQLIKDFHINLTNVDIDDAASIKVPLTYPKQLIELLLVEYDPLISKNITKVSYSAERSLYIACHLEMMSVLCSIGEYIKVIEKKMSVHESKDLVNIDNENFIILILQFVHTRISNYISSYNYITKKVTKIKLEEKKMKTDYMKGLEQQELVVEKMKKNLKLGQWGFALDQKRVYKYNKEFYKVDKDEATFILDNIQKETNGEQIDIYGDKNADNEELDNDLAFLPDDDDYGSDMDGDELY